MCLKENYTFAIKAIKEYSDKFVQIGSEEIQDLLVSAYSLQLIDSDAYDNEKLKSKQNKNKEACASLLQSVCNRIPLSMTYFHKFLAMLNEKSGSFQIISERIHSKWVELMQNSTNIVCATSDCTELIKGDQWVRTHAEKLPGEHITENTDLRRELKHKSIVLQFYEQEICKTKKEMENECKEYENKIEILKTKHEDNIQQLESQKNELLEQNKSLKNSLESSQENYSTKMKQLTRAIEKEKIECCKREKQLKDDYDIQILRQSQELESKMKEVIELKSAIQTLKHGKQLMAVEHEKQFIAAEMEKNAISFEMEKKLMAVKQEKQSMSAELEKKIMTIEHEKTKTKMQTQAENQEKDKTIIELKAQLSQMDIKSEYEAKIKDLEMQNVALKSQTASASISPRMKAIAQWPSLNEVD